MVTANLTFTQNAVSPGPGISMVGVDGLVVTLSNATDGGVSRWVYELLDAPLNSALVPGILSSGSSPTADFTPDTPATPGCYRIKLTVFGGGSSSSMIRNFAVPTTQGWLLPPFKGSAAELNFPGNSEGWESLLNTIFLSLSASAGGPTGSALFVGIKGSVPGPSYALPDFTAGEIDTLWYICTRTCLVHRLWAHVRNAPGGVAEFVTVTVLLNGAPTAVTCTMTGPADAANDLVNSFVAAPGDLISFEVTTSLGSSASDLSVTLEIG